MMNRDPLQRVLRRRKFGDEHFQRESRRALSNRGTPHSAAPRSGRHSCSEAPFPVLAPDHVASIAAVLAIAGTAAAITLLRSPVADTSTFSCYSQVSLNPHAIEVFPIAGDPLSVLWHGSALEGTAREPFTKGFPCVWPTDARGISASKITDVAL